MLERFQQHFLVLEFLVFLRSSTSTTWRYGSDRKKDLLIIFSYSGNTSELKNMLRYANRYRIKIIGVASKPESILLKASDVKILIPKVKVWCNWYGANIKHFDYSSSWRLFSYNSNATKSSLKKSSKSIIREVILVILCF